jgi:uracil-DNA glycosylase
MQRTLFVGQALPRTDPGRPFGRTHLYRWFDSVGISEEVIAQFFYFTALANYFPGSAGRSHRVPSPEEIVSERPRLIKEINEVQPEIIIPVGKLSIQEFLGIENVKLDQVIGNKFQRDPLNTLGHEIPIIPFPHPSGASSWYYQPENQQLLKNALQLLRLELDVPRYNTGS